jgi:hypothetical protein
MHLALLNTQQQLRQSELEKVQVSSLSNNRQKLPQRLRDIDDH